MTPTTKIREHKVLYIGMKTKMELTKPNSIFINKAGGLYENAKDTEDSVTYVFFHSSNSVIRKVEECLTLQQIFTFINIFRNKKFDEIKTTASINKLYNFNKFIKKDGDKYAISR